MADDAIEVTDPRLHRANEIVREIAIGGLAGVIAGVVVLGIGGRLFMRIVAVMDPAANGLFTENGNRIGAITPGGTADLIFFVGLFGGVVGGIVWTVVGPWIPGRGPVRAVLGGLAAVGLGAFLVVRADARDFRILEPRPIILALLIGLIVVFGVTVAIVEASLRRRLPASGVTFERSDALYVAAVAIGAIFVPPIVAQYLGGTGTAIPGTPIDVGFALVVVGLATLGSWYGRVSMCWAGSRVLTAIARSGLAVAVILGWANVLGAAGALLA